jgi:hypothetical protein
VELSARYINDRKLPDKAIDVIDETGASADAAAGNKRKKTIGVKEIEAPSPPWRASRRRPSPRTMPRFWPRTWSKDLKRVVYGQDKAIESLSSAIKLARAGLREPDKPIGSYLFSGPTGVGKTEVAKQLASSLGVELLRFDMSEYMERHTVSRLIGAPPGYVGFDQGGLLTDGVDQHPHCVLLLDEIEKAHPDLFNILLQVMDHGKLTDHNGKQVDFRNVILIMTTNAGAADMAKAAIGFGRVQARRRRSGSDQPAVHAGVPQPSRCDHPVRQPAAKSSQGGREVRHAAGGPAGRPQRDLRADRRRRRLARRQGLRRANGRPAAGPGDPGATSSASRWRTRSVRQAPATAKTTRKPSGGKGPSKSGKPDPEASAKSEEPKAAVAEKTAPRKPSSAVPKVPRKK